MLHSTKLVYSFGIYCGDQLELATTWGWGTHVAAGRSQVAQPLIVLQLRVLRLTIVKGKNSIYIFLSMT
jgi:hypothetical protein